MTFTIRRIVLKRMLIEAEIRFGNIGALALSDSNAMV